MLQEPDEDGDASDGVVPAGYKFMFHYFGDRVDVEGSTSGKLCCFRWFLSFSLLIIIFSFSLSLFLSFKETR